MSEEKEIPAKEKCLQEYLQLCADLGNVHYQISALEKGIPSLLEKMEKANKKMDFLQKDELARLNAEKEMDNGTKETTH